LTSSEDVGGDPPCWAHLVDDDRDDTVLVKLADLLRTDGDGAVWSLPANASSDLNVNLVQLSAHASIDAHRNDEVDVVLFVRSGAGEIVVDNRISQIAADQLALIPRSSTRAIRAGSNGLVYLSIHRVRSPMTPRRRA
jgi:mannose-6-phosphate isomerase-like protein (cupin superfamily)